MLDLERLRRIRLHTRPIGQVLVANGFLAFDLRFPRRTRVTMIGGDNIPKDRNVFLAMNHTDKFSYWPLQYHMIRMGAPYTATWVKGKYYQNPAVAWFMDSCNNIPMPSRGFVLTTEFRKLLDRVPSADEYRALRDLANAGKPLADVAELPADVARFLEFKGGPAGFLSWFDTLYGQMTDEVTSLNEEALRRGCNVLVFPQGTRSKRLSRGHIGMMQMAQRLGADIVPIGCSGADSVYPADSPFSKGGKITYRIGAPLRLDGPELGQFRVTEPFRPFSREAKEQHNAAFQGATDVVMSRINALVDAPYQFSEDQESDGVQGISRFV